MTNAHKQQLEYFIKDKDYSSAESFLISIKSEYPDDLDYWYFLVNINRKLGRAEQAEGICQKAILKYPDSSQLNFELGIIYQTKGEFKKAIEHFKIVIETKEDVSLTQVVDTLNSLALTYKYGGDSVNSLKYYNLALEELAQGIYMGIKNDPLRGTDLQDTGFNYTGEEEEGWVRLATQIVIKNSANDGIKACRFPTGETAQKIVKESPVIGVAIYDDKDTNRYVLPAYFSSFYLALKSNIYYSNIVNNIGVLYSETGDNREAKKCFEESIRFIPKGVEYKNPYIGLESLQKNHVSENIDKQSGNKFFVVPQTEKEIEQNRKKIEELRAKGLLQEHEKTFKIQKDGTVVEEE